MTNKLNPPPWANHQHNEPITQASSTPNWDKQSTWWCTPKWTQKTEPPRHLKREVHSQWLPKDSSGNLDTYGSKTLHSRKINQWNWYGKDSCGKFRESQPSEIPSPSKVKVAFKYLEDNTLFDGLANVSLVGPSNPQINCLLMFNSDKEKSYKSSSNDSLESF